MADARINLLKKKKSRPEIALWQNRLGFLLVIVVLVVFFDIAAIAAVRLTLLPKEKALRRKKELLASDINSKKNAEGLYLTLISRLSAIESAERRDIRIQNLPRLVDEIVRKGGSLRGIEVGGKNIKIEFGAAGPKEIAKIVNGFREYSGGDYTFSDFRTEKTEIGKDGIYTVSLAMIVDRKFASGAD